MSFCVKASHGSFHAWNEIKMVKCHHCGLIEEKCPKSPGAHKWETVTGKDPLTLMENWGDIPGIYCVHCHKKKRVKISLI